MSQPHGWHLPAQGALHADAIFTSNTGLVMLSALTLGVLPWWHTLKTACVLVSDAVDEAAHLIRRFTPAEPEWDSKVVPAVVRLCDVTLPCLSRGWGPALLTCFVAFWFVTVTTLTTFMETRAVGVAILTLFFALAPVGIAFDAVSLPKPLPCCVCASCDVM